MIRHLTRRVVSALRERAKEKRSPKWRHVRDAFLIGKTCVVCGGNTQLEVHHVEPFHLAPARELDPTNLIVLCMGPGDHHLMIGHGGSFHAYNPDVLTHAAAAHAAHAIDDTKAIALIEADARRLRLPITVA